MYVSTSDARFRWWQYNRFRLSLQDRERHIYGRGLGLSHVTDVDLTAMKVENGKKHLKLRAAERELENHFHL